MGVLAIFTVFESSEKASTYNLMVKRIFGE